MWSYCRSSYSDSLGVEVAASLHVNWKPLAARLPANAENFVLGVEGLLRTSTLGPVAEGEEDEGDARTTEAKKATRQVKRSETCFMAGVPDGQRRPLCTMFAES